MKKSLIVPIAAAVLSTLTTAGFAADKSWNNASQSGWNTAGNWSPSGAPISTDNVVTPTAFGNVLIDVVNPSINDLTYNSSSSWLLIGNNGSSNTLSLGGALSKAGSGSLTFRSSSSSNVLALSVTGGASVTGGNLYLGARAGTSGQELTGFSAASLTISGATTQVFMNVGGSGAAVSGNVSMDSSSKLLFSVGPTSGSSRTVSVGSLESASSSAIIAANDYSSGSTIGTLIINASSGSKTFAGQIKDTTGGATASVVHIQKDNGSTQVLSGANTYKGSTIINGGVLQVDGAHAGGGAYTVNSGGTLAGTGSISLAANTNATVANGGKLLASSADSLAFTLSGTGILDVSGALGGSQSMFFTLASPSSTVISLSGGGLAIGSGLLEFADFSFAQGAGFGSGTYTLFGGASSLSGSLGANLSGSIGGGYTGTVSLSGNDLVLSVVPEPGAWFLAALGLTTAVVIRRRRI